MTPKEFFDHWVSFVGSGKLDQFWTEYSAWTSNTIGAPHSEGAGKSPFGEYLCQQEPPGLSYWKEDRNIDLALSRASNFRLSALRKGDTEYPEGFYPRCYDILVEQEANGWTSWQELLKLIHMRARLKVVITYGEDVMNTDRPTTTVSDGIRSMFQEGIKQAATALGEDPNTRYLLIVGQKTGKGIAWFGWAFDGNGFEKWCRNTLQA